MKYKQYTVIGIIFLLVSAFLLVVDIILNGGLLGWFFITLAFSILAFTVGYINPRLSDDERAKFIRSKSVNYSFFFIIGYLIIAFGLKTWLDQEINTQSLFMAFASLSIATLCVSLIVTERRN
ncbi:hypothetical protein EV207_1739 [Scopulibacillus darangshiensis]|uniref:Uncharacterized protein n=1 Tax=Scopulibacillus darangshiensis TaxID=442528 RepID=A0A4R2NAJ1_9BACL|nr:hypothetical protein [Scopulibacillus darangshiensis]TCP18030.1 hypothetical protein EV207_1739 [Scopulibacillus darangshiensis]